MLVVFSSWLPEILSWLLCSKNIDICKQQEPINWTLSIWPEKNEEFQVETSARFCENIAIWNIVVCIQIQLYHLRHTRDVVRCVSARNSECIRIGMLTIVLTFRCVLICHHKWHAIRKLCILFLSLSMQKNTHTHRHQQLRRQQASNNKAQTIIPTEMKPTRETQ